MKRKNINLASLVISLFTACGSNEKNKEIVSIEPGTTEVTTTDPRINERQTENPDFNTELERYGFKEIFYDPERPETAEFQEAFDSYTIGDLINADNTTTFDRQGFATTYDLPEFQEAIFNDLKPSIERVVTEDTNIQALTFDLVRSWYDNNRDLGQSYGFELSDTDSVFIGKTNNTTYIILNGSLNRTDSTSEDSKVPIIYFKPRIDNTYLFVEAFAR